MKTKARNCEIAIQPQQKVFILQTIVHVSGEAIRETVILHVKHVNQNLYFVYDQSHYFGDHIVGGWKADCLQK